MDKKHARLIISSLSALNVVLLKLAEKGKAFEKLRNNQLGKTVALHRARTKDSLAVQLSASQPPTRPGRPSRKVKVESNSGFVFSAWESNF